MLLAHVEWISALCSVLTLVCTIQLILSGLILWSIPEVLTLTKNHISTVASLIAGFITLPAVIRFKTARTFPKMDRIYGYTLCYQRLTISVAGTLHLTALLLAVYSLMKSVKLGDDFKKLMKSYQVRSSSKILVDNIQFVFQCCGGYAYSDWTQTRNVESSTKTEVFLKEDETYNFVPFSCCSKFVLAPCDFRDLEFGLDTINKDGCGHKLETFVHTLLWFEIVLNFVSFILEVGVLGLLREAASESNSSSLSDKSGKWGSFTNNTSSMTSLWHSSHSEKRIPNKDKQ